MILKESGEMYLETIYILSLKRSSVRSVDVAKHMGFSGASVCRAVRILQHYGYLVQDDNKCLLLTKAGKKRAKMIYERHSVLTSFLVSIGVSESVASKDSCRLEHYMSEETFQAIQKTLEELSK